MLRLFLVLLFLLAVCAAGFIIQQYDFPVTAEFKGYLLETSSARIAVILILFFIVLFSLLKVIFWLKDSPRRLLGKIRRENEQQGYRDIMNGFSALAAGNAPKALKFAGKAHKALPKQPLVKLLQAQVAVYSDKKDEAVEYYKALAETEEGRFAGFRGLISQSIAGNKLDKALEIADDLLRDNPKSPWLNEALIDLAFRTSDWDRLERYLKKAEANKALDKVSLNERFAVFYYMKAKIAYKEARLEDAEWLAERSRKYKGDFLPAALFLSDLYFENEEYKKARNLVEKIWGEATHPVLMKNYELAVLNSGHREKAKKVRKLFEKNPDDVESAAFYARVLIEERHSDEAREILSHALKIRETKMLCKLMSQVDDKVAWEMRLDKALDDKCWYCTVTGTRYAEWQPYSDSGALNTITWGFPPEMPRTLLADDKFLFIN